MTPVESPAAGKSEILIVGACPASLDALSIWLAEAGYAVRSAPEDTLDLLGARRPDFILLDILAEGTDGFDVCRRLKADPVSADLPLIFLSARTDAVAKLRGLSLGAVDYIVKPYHGEEVLARIRLHLTLAHRRGDAETERGLLEQRVSERTAELERQGREMDRILTALDMAGDGIAILDAVNRFRYINHPMLETMGFKAPEEVIGRRTEDILTSETPLFRMTELQMGREEALRHGLWSGEISLMRPGDKRARRLLAHFRMLRDGERVVVFTDVTEAHRREEERRRLEWQLEQARKLESLGQLAAGITHDFNNLLGAILGFAQFILDDSGADTSQYYHAGRILKAGQQAKSLIRQILAFSQRREATLERIDLGGMISDNVSLLKAIVAPATSLQVASLAENMIVVTQAGQLMQLLINLVLNASEAHYGRPGSVIIGVDIADLGDPAVRRLLSLLPSEDTGEPPAAFWTDGEGIHHGILGLLRSGRRYLRLSVTDDGDGMTEAVATQIFDPFFTTKGMLGGTGLGLAFVRDFILSHQGGLLLRTAPDRGSRFDILLPAVEAVGTPEEAGLLRTVPVPHRGSILLVEDSSHFGDMLMTALFRLGYEISVCDDPRDAVGYVAEDPAAWDLVIADLLMPHMSGTDLVAGIKRLRPDLPCIICTAFPNDLTEAAARQAGADGLATKPLDIGRFSVMVKTLISGTADEGETFWLNSR